MIRVSILIIFVTVLCTAMAQEPTSKKGTSFTAKDNRSTMQLGTFSVSLAVKDLKASQAFYEKLGFKQFAGDPTKNWVILQNETATIGLFQGMFDKNILTFNPGWDRNANTLERFEDVRSLQRELKRRGIEPVVVADESTSGPASLVVVDPDGNQILLDQHVASPRK